jgi:hypothetical protein
MLPSPGSGISEWITPRARGHPLGAAGADGGAVPEVVLVLEAAVQHDRERLDAAVGVRGKARHELVAPLRADLVEHQEGIEVVLRAAHDTADLDARAVGGGLALEDLANASVAHVRSPLVEPGITIASTRSKINGKITHNVFE